MKAIISSFLIGSIFGFGLAISEMINPARVIGFLDVTGQWDPTLLAVLAGALLVAATLFPLVLRRNRALLADRLVLPTKTEVDTPLILGALIFGIGWGLAGLCPGPALAGLASASSSLAGFVIAMIAGQWLVSIWQRLET
jgi:uncharacterized membrane protein YedE/YeeE